MNSCKLFSLPYAGGSSLIFSDWRNFLEPRIDLIPLELKGRGQRSQEGYYANIYEAALDIFEKMVSQGIKEKPYCLFGQSLGGLIIFEMLQLIVKNHLPLPFHIFFSAIFPPHINKIDHKLHELPDKTFIKQLTRWAALPESIAKNEEMIQLWIPILKADYKVLENYHFKPTIFKYPIDFSILKGKTDFWLSNKEYHEWNCYTDRDIEFYEINGGHLFIIDQKKEIISIINKTIDEYF